MLRKGNIIKHKYFSDVAFLITTAQRYSPDYYTIKGEWINQGFDSTYDLGIRQTLKIKNDDIHDWLLCIEPRATCIRYADWRRL